METKFLENRRSFNVRISTKRHQSIKFDDKIQFFEQLSILTNAGVPLLTALRLVADQSESERLHKIIQDVADQVSSGISLSESMASFPNLFASHWVHSVRMGEISGQLGEVLFQLKEHMIYRRNVQAKVKQALIYPIILMFVAIIAIVTMLWKVIPSFAVFFEDSGTKMPAITQAVLDLSTFVQEYGLVVFVLLGVLALGLRLYLRTDRGKSVLTRRLAALPIVGGLFVTLSMERFVSSLGLLLASGIPLLEAIKSVREMFIGNYVYHATLDMVYQDLSNGRGLGYSLETTRVFTPMVVSVIKIGEESGKLPEVLRDLSKFYAARIENRVLTVTGMLEPLIIVGMGVVIAFMLGTVYLPMFQMSAM